MIRQGRPILCLAALVACWAGCDSTPANPSRSSLPAQSLATPSSPSRLHFTASFREGSEQALREKKPLLLFFTASWCEHCQRMVTETFSARQVADFSERFVCVRIDADQDAALCQRFGVTEFPTVQFVSARGAALTQVVGRCSPPDLLGEMQTALQAVAYDVETTPIRR